MRVMTILHQSHPRDSKLPDRCSNTRYQRVKERLEFAHPDVNTLFFTAVIPMRGFRPVMLGRLERHAVWQP
jgi:hypothetical protein